MATLDDIINGLHGQIRPETKPMSLKEGFQRVGSGLLSSIPTIPLDLYSLVDSGLKLTNGVDKEVLPGAEKAYEMARDVEHTTRDLVGLEDLRDPLTEMGDIDSARALTEFGGSLLIPGGLLGKLAGAAGKATKAGRVLKALGTGADFLVGAPAGIKGRAIGLGIGAGGVDLAQRLNEQKQTDAETERNAVIYGTAGLAAALMLKDSKAAKSLRQKVGAATKAVTKQDPLSKGSLRSATIDREVGIQNAFNQVVPDVAEQERFADRVALAERAGSVDTQARELFISGSLPDHPGLKMRTPLVKMVEKGGALTEDQHKILHEGIDALDRQTNEVFRNFTDPLGQTERNRRINLARQDPAVWDLIQDVRSYYRNWAEVAYRHGVFKPSTMKSIRNGNFFYSPAFEQIKKTPGQKIQSILFGNVDDAQANQLISEIFQRSGSLPPDFARMNAFDAAEQYGQHMLSFIRKNDYKAQLMQNLAGYRPTKGAKPIVEKVKAGGDISVINNGVKEFYKVHSPVLKDALHYNPAVSNLIVRANNQARKVQQQFITGSGNPFFAPISLWYDVMSGAMLPQGKYKFGMFPGDVASPLVNEVARGMYHGGTARLAQGISAYLSNSIRRGGIAKYMPGADIFADVMGKAYTNSWLHKAQSVGAVSPHTVLDASDLNGVVSQMKGLAPAASTSPTGRALWNAYNGALTTIKESARLGMFVRNAKPEMSFEQMANLSRRVRELAGDPGKEGSAQTIKNINRSVLYSNMYLQEMDRYAQAFKSNPVRTTTALLTGAVVPALGSMLMMSMNPEFRDYYWNKLDPRQRGNLWIYLPSMKSPEEMIEVQMPGPIRALIAASVHGIDQMIGIQNGSIDTPEGRESAEAAARTLLPDIGTAIMNYSPVGGSVLNTPAIETTLALTPGGEDGLGYKLNPGYYPGSGQSPLESIRGTHTAGVNAAGYSKPNDILSARWNELMSQYLGMVGNLGIETARAIKWNEDSGRDPIDDALEVASMTAKRRTPFVSGLFAPELRRISGGTNDAKTYYSKVNAMKTISQIMSENIRQADVLQTGKHASVLENDIGKNVDPRMIPLYQHAAQAGKIIMSLDDDIGLMRDQRNAAEVSPKYSPKQRAMIVRQYDEAIFSRQQEYNDMIRDYEDDLSDVLEQISGVRRPVRMEDLTDPRTTLDDLIQ